MNKQINKLETHTHIEDVLERDGTEEEEGSKESSSVSKSGTQ